jgi:hypothetical protein
MRYTSIRGFGTVMEDAGILKNVRFTERMRTQIRAELLNIFNRHQFGGIQTSVTKVEPTGSARRSAGHVPPKRNS